MKKTELYKKIILSIFCLILPALLFAQSRPLVTSINAVSKAEGKIELTWLLSSESKKSVSSLQIYRDTKPILTYETLFKLSPYAEAQPDEYSFTDTPSDYKEYFYAVIAVTANGPYNILIPSQNTTTKGIKIHTVIASSERVLNQKTKKADYSDGHLREIPLPEPDINSKNEASKIKMSKEAKENARDLSTGYNKKSEPFKKLYFFEEDMISPDGGDDYVLFQTLRSSLVRKKYAAAVNELKEFLSVRRSKEVTARAQFYLGEAYYFCREYKEALDCFLKTSDYHKELSSMWIDSCLDQMEIKY